MVTSCGYIIIKRRINAEIVYIEIGITNSNPYCLFITFK